MTDVDLFLAHYGVKGMRWGVTRARDSIKSAVKRGKEKRAAVKAERKAISKAAAAAGYTTRQRTIDFQDVGRKGVRKIEKRIADGEKINVARFKVQAATTAKGLAVGTAILAGPVALIAADRGAANLAATINAKRGAEAARQLFADEKGLMSYATVALSFDEATKSWK